MLKISVIVPVYNVEKYLNQCLDSIVNQTLKDIEIICIDAGSTDGSLDILKEYQIKDKRISVIHNSERIDAGAARNIGLEKAKGEYLAILDSDDFFDLNMLNDAYNRAKKDNSDIVVFYANQYDMKNNKLSFMPWSMKAEYCPFKRVFSPDEMSRFVFNCFQNWTWNKLFKTAFIKENNIVFQSVARTNDMAFTCQALALSKRISLLKKAYPVYRVGTQTSLQATNHKAPTAFWEAYIETQKRLKNDGVFEKFEQSFLNAVLSGIIYNLDSVKSEEAYNEILNIIKNSGEKEFHIGSHPRNYYINTAKYNEYIDIVNKNSEKSYKKSNGDAVSHSYLKKIISFFIKSRFMYMIHATLIKLNIIKY